MSSSTPSSPSSPPSSGKRKKPTPGWVSFAKTIAVVLMFRAFVAEAYKIPSGSMIPTLQVGDRIWVNHFIYGLRVPLWGKKFFTRSPKRGEVVVFVHPKKGEDLIKRVIGVAGDRVEVRDGMVWVNDEKVAVEPESAACDYHDYDEEQDRWYAMSCDQYKESIGRATFTSLRNPEMPPSQMPVVTVPPASLFVMGDNRDNSSDSRYWGFVPLENVKGQAMFVWWSSGGSGPDGMRWSRFFQPVR